METDIGDIQVSIVVAVGCGIYRGIISAGMVKDEKVLQIRKDLCVNLL